MEPEELLSHASFLTALARSLVVDEHVAADLIQDTWVAALEHPPSSKNHLKAWLSTAARNFLRMRQRGENRRRRREYAYAPGEGIPSPEEIVAQEELRRKVVAAVLSLDEPYRSTIILRYYKDLPHKEVARRLGVPIETMRTRLKKGIALLKNRLDKAHGGNRKRWLVVMASMAGLSAGEAVAGGSSILAGAAVMSTKMKCCIASILVFGISVITVMVMQLESTKVKTMEPDSPIVETKADDSLVFPLPLEGEVEMKREPIPAKRLNEQKPLLDESMTFTIAGRTLDRDGFPMPDARILLKSSPDAPLALSGSDGSFAPELLLEKDRGRRHETIVIRKPGYLTRQFDCVLDPSEETIHLGDVVLERGATLTGTVLDRDGRVVAGAEIGFSVFQALGEAMEGIQRRRGQGVQVVQRADAAGLFRLEEVPEGWISVWARAGDSLYTPSRPVEVHAGDEIGDIEIVLQRMAEDDFIAGLVLDPDDLPLPGAEIRVIVNEGDGSESWYTEEADVDGRFTTRLYRKKPHSLEARDPDGRYDAARADHVEPGTHDLVLKLRRFKKEIELHVSSTGTRLLDAYEVRIHSPLDGRVLCEKSCVNAPPSSSGHAAIPVPNSPFYLSIKADGFDEAASEVYYPNTLPESIEMLVRPLPGVQGRVLAAGVPAEGVKVGLYRQMGGELLVCDFLCRSLLQAEFKTVSDKEGRFDLGINTSGIYYLRCECEGFATTELGPLELDKNIGKSGLVIKLLRGGAIEGEVIVPAGRDRAGIVVAVSRGDGRPLSFRTGPDGHFLFEGLTPGPWQVERREQMIMPETRFVSFSNIRNRPSVEWDCWVEEGRCTRFDLDLTGLSDCRLEGKLTLEGSAPMGWTCEVADDLTKTLIQQTDLGLDGSFTLQIEKPGEYHLKLAGRIGESAIIVIHDRVILIPGENAWSHDLSIGSLKVKGRLLNGSVYFRWSGLSELHAYVPIPLGSKESTVSVPVPTGHGVIVHREAFKEGETVLCEVEAKGEESLVELGTIGH